MFVAIILMVGILVGIFSHAYLPAKGGLLGSAGLGILGAIEGGFFRPLVFNTHMIHFDLGSVLFAVLGAMFLLFIQRTSTYYKFAE